MDLSRGDILSFHPDYHIRMNTLDPGDTGYQIFFQKVVPDLPHAGVQNNLLPFCSDHNTTGVNLLRKPAPELINGIFRLLRER